MSQFLPLLNFNLFSILYVDISSSPAIYTAQGIGSKVLKQSGWKEGSGIGRSSKGRPEPVDTEGQHPHNKTGFG